MFPLWKEFGSGKLLGSSLRKVYKKELLRRLATTAGLCGNGRSKANLIYNSPVSTYHLQPRIPQLPLPKLQDTCARYLQSLRAVLSADQMNESEKIVKQFQKGAGKELQAELESLVTEDPKLNYVSRYWNDMYLKSRYPLLHNFNIFVGITDTTRQGYDHPVIRATNFTVALCKFMKALEAEKLEPYGFKTKPNRLNKHMLRYLSSYEGESHSSLKTVMPICMSQFHNIFKSTRIPEDDRDILQVFPDSKHIIVMRNGQFYVVDVLDDNGDILPANVILANIKCAYDKQDRPHLPIAVLTAGDRDTWKAARDQLIQDGNESALQMIDSAIYVAALDEDMYKNEDAAAKGFLQGNGHNRWYDKPLTMVFTEGGRCAFHMEHSWGDGMSILYPVNCAFDDISLLPSVGPDTTPADGDASEHVRRLEFNISEDIGEEIRKNKEWFDETCATLNIQYFQFDKFGANFIKSQKISPDSFIQLGFQLAFYRLYGYTPSTYESCSTALYRQGRTETMRPATVATKRVCEMLTSGAPLDQNEFRAALSDCSKMHGKLATEAAMGHGYDRHLFALRNLAAEKGLETPSIFADPAYAMMCNYVLSTSTVGETPAVSLGAFAPVAADGYGIGYGVYKEEIKGSITSYQTRDCQGFVDCLNQSLDDMANMLQKS